MSARRFDPLFWDDITVRRRQQVITQNGRVSVQTTTFAMQAVVVAASPNDLQRVPDYQQMGKAISIYGIMPRLQGPALNVDGTQTQPDQVEWHGSLYVVRLLEDYSGYGRGFFHAVAESVQSVDPPPDPFVDVLGNA